MWMTKLWVLVYAVCSWPGADSQSCSYHFIEGFASKRICEAAAPKLGETIQPHKADAVPVRISPLAPTVEEHPDGRLRVNMDVQIVEKEAGE
jgi:hypothetical protein